MKDVLSLRKTSTALQLSVQLTRTALAIAQVRIADEPDFRQMLLDASHEILARCSDVEVASVSDTAFDALCRVMGDPAYDPSLAARESEAGFFLDLDTVLTKLRRSLEAAHNENQRMLPTTAFCIGVDGSRQAYRTFEVVTRLRRQGAIKVIHVQEDKGSRSMQMPVIPGSFIAEEYKAHAQRLQLPSNRVTIEFPKDGSASDSVATQLLDRCAQYETDILAVGAIGKGGPAIDQVGHVPHELLRLTTLPVLLVSPAPVNAMTQRSYLHVVAIDDDVAIASRCLNAALKLVHPDDTLRIVHFYRKPIAGSFDDQSFAFCRAFLETAQIQGDVDLVPLETGWTVAESIQDYVAKHRASYLVMGTTGAGSHRKNGGEDDTTQGFGPQEDTELENRIGRVTAAMLLSPRCALCICP